MDRQAVADMRWSVEKAYEYMRKLGTIKGCNFVPSYCYGYIEIWHHYREDYILRELDYLVKIGLNSVRIFVLCAQWQTHRDLVYQNLDRFLDACRARGITVMLCLQTGTVIPKGYVQKSEDPIIINFHPGCHDRSWVFEGMMMDKDNQYNDISLDFVRDIVTRYGHDDRVTFFDLYNEAPDFHRELVKDIFAAARECDPMQPLTACWEAHDLSDVVSFHCYRDPKSDEMIFPITGGKTFSEEVGEALSYGRPTLCTECMARTVGNELFDFLPIYQEKKIGFYVWGLCEASAGYRFPWGWPEGSPEPKRWSHGLLYPDGTPYDEKEIPLLRAYHYTL